MNMKSSENTNTKVADHKLYKRRWLMLFLFMIYVFNGLQQWPQFTIISNLVTQYYNVTRTQVEWTSNIFLLSYIVLVVPALYVIDALGVRYTLIAGATGITIGSWLKVFSVAPDRFSLTFLGQCCSISSFMLTYGLIGRFTALWFGANEISTSGVLVMLGDQLGTAFGYTYPTVVVKDGSEEVIGNGLRSMHLYVSITSTVILFLILFLFEDKPKIPPSIAQVQQKRAEKENIMTTLIKLLTNSGFLLFMISYGFTYSAFIGLATCLNEVVVGDFPGAVRDAGNIGTLMMLSGTVSSLLVGRILDRTRLFKESAVILTCCATISMIILTWSLKSGNILYVYLGASLVGFSVLGYYSSGIQLAIELSYPVREEISTAISFLCAGVLGCIEAVGYGHLIKKYGVLVANIGVIAMYGIAVFTALCIPRNMKRQKAENEPKTAEMKEFI